MLPDFPPPPLFSRPRAGLAIVFSTGSFFGLATNAVSVRNNRVPTVGLNEKNNFQNSNKKPAEISKVLRSLKQVIPNVFVVHPFEHLV